MTYLTWRCSQCPCSDFARRLCSHRSNSRPSTRPTLGASSKRFRVRDMAVPPGARRLTQRANGPRNQTNHLASLRMLGRMSTITPYATAQRRSAGMLSNWSARGTPSMPYVKLISLTMLIMTPNGEEESNVTDLIHKVLLASNLKPVQMVSFTGEAYMGAALHRQCHRVARYKNARSAIRIRNPKAENWERASRSSSKPDVPGRICLYRQIEGRRPQREQGGRCTQCMSTCQERRMRTEPFTTPSYPSRISTFLFRSQKKLSRAQSSVREFPICSSCLNARATHLRPKSSW